MSREIKSKKAVELEDLLRMHFEAITEERHLRPFNDMEIKVVKKLGNSYDAYIDLTNWRMHFTVQEDLLEQLEAMKVKHGIGGIESLHQLVYTRLIHEYGHYKWCPRTNEGHQAIMEGVHDALRKKERNQEKLQADAGYLSNMFSDTVLNTVNAHIDSHKETYREGFDLGTLLRLTPLPGSSGRGFALFLESNHLLCATNPEIYQKMERSFPWFFPGHGRKIEKVLTVFTGDNSLTNAVLNNAMSDQAATDLVGRIRELSLWNTMAYDYAKLLYPYLRQSDRHLMDHSHEEEEEEGHGPTTNTPSPTPSRHSDRQGKGNQPLTSGNSSYLRQFGKLDILYTQRAGRITLFAEDPTYEAPQYERDIGIEALSLDDIARKRVFWSQTKIIPKEDGTNHVELYSGAVPLQFEIETTETPGFLPDIGFIVDSSISMDFQPFEKEGAGQYHFAVLAMYSILRYLEETGNAYVLNYHAINFSEKTTSSGWCSYYEFERIKQTFFDYQCKGTELDPQALRNMREQRRGNFICFMLSDTFFNELDNQAEILKEVEALVETPGIGFYLFQLGMHSSFSQDLEKRGIPVHLIRTTEDFMNLSIRFTKDLYGKVIR